MPDREIIFVRNRSNLGGKSHGIHGIAIVVQLREMPVPSWLGAGTYDR